MSYDGEPGPGVLLGGTWTETYTGYSDDGKSFVDGTMTVTGLTEGTWSAHLKMTGAHVGSQDAEIALKRLSVKGHATSTLDGHTISGPDPDMLDGGACRSMLPAKPAVRATAKRLRGGSFRVTVTASVAGMGPTESATDTRPVTHARVRVGGRTVVTDARGVATVTRPARGGPARATVSAGDTLKATSLTLR